MPRCYAWHTQAQPVDPATNLSQMPSFGRYLRSLFGRCFAEGGYQMIFSVRLDETGTDGISRYTVVAGAVSTGGPWDKLEAAWDRLLGPGIQYHWSEFQDGDGPFKGWSEFKRKRFVGRQEKIICGNTLFRVSIGVEAAAHAEIKRRMKGIKGFHPDSDYGLCLRYLMFTTSEQLMRVDPRHRLSILVEDGPWAAGAATTYQRVAAMTGKRKPARHAHRLAGFATAPKGIYRSLEVADYLAGTEHAWMTSGGKRPARGAERLSMLLTREVLQEWYEGMIEEKVARRAYASAKKAALLSGKQS